MHECFRHGDRQEIGERSIQVHGVRAVDGWYEAAEGKVEGGVDVKVGFVAGPLSWRVEVRPSDRQPPRQTRRWAEPEFYVYNNRVVISPRAPTVRARREGEDRRPSDDAWGDRDVVQQRQLRCACVKFAAGEKPLLQRGAWASN
jgi:hypothetical protein